MKYISSVVLFLILISCTGFSQDTTESLAFKNKRPRQKSPYFYRPDLAYQIWQKFKLTQEANAGDPLAEHELGLRYLLGEGMPADTSQAVYWIKKAADQKLTSAEYNYAILLINGIGVPWDPFKAFKLFQNAADDGMVQAQYVVGILYTDNLTVRRDYNLAYYWIKKAADNDYEPAKEIVAKLEPRASKMIVDSLLNTSSPPKEENPIPDPSENLTSSLGLVFVDLIYFKRNLIEAGVYYYRALRNDSPLGTNLLWQLSRDPEFIQTVQKESEAGNNIAKFLWYGLTAINFSNRIVISDALILLDESAKAYYLPAMVESGLNHYTSRFGRSSIESGLNIWKTAAQLGSKEAKIRLTASRVLDSFGAYNKKEDFKILKKASEEGSLFAMVSVGLCYLQGLGVKKSIPDAVNNFRSAAQRGSRFAYEELKRIYDERRPADSEFRISN
ncbi:MAG: hypothetical protein P8X47_13550 [Ignavibacteriaceae bacterium]